MKQTAARQEVTGIQLTNPAYKRVNQADIRPLFQLFVLLNLMLASYHSKAVALQYQINQ